MLSTVSVLGHRPFLPGLGLEDLESMIEWLQERLVSRGTLDG